MEWVMGRNHILIVNDFVVLSPSSVNTSSAGFV